MPRSISSILIILTLFFISGLKRNKQTTNEYSLYQSIEIDGIYNLSGITYNQKTQTYWLINNSPSLILEINSNGKVLRKIQIREGVDSEDICWIKDNIFAIVEESNNRLLIIEIAPGAQEVSCKNALYSWSAPGKFTSNKGLESVAYNPQTNSFLCASEKRPISFFEVYFSNRQLTGYEIFTDSSFETYVEDVAAMSFRESQKIILSEDSKLILLLDKNDKVKDMISLEKGLNGLTAEIEQPEGICFVNDTMAVVSEPNMLYLFKKTANSFSIQN
ncbi:MAG: SdiA-regulated domain-containing protein [Lentisphaeraceae bacterium]|nr:SdiA-regulated domain-containing protein [Lentisphaeraceae bacterium]